MLTVPTGYFFMLKIHVPVDITEELSPNVRMIPKSVPLKPARFALRFTNRGS